MVLCCSCAPKGMNQHCFTWSNTAATCECDDCAGPGTGERKPGPPQIPLARAALPWEEEGSTLASLATGVCGHAADLPASHYSFQCMAELVSPSTTSQAASSLSSLAPERAASQARLGQELPSLSGMERQPTNAVSTDGQPGHCLNFWTAAQASI